ncbi:MAG: hypothetical protein Q8Q14_11845, partial [Gemmatimonadales bacterium]|nr:hypothetical protein [Gemmatimonadales bacterium]
EVSAPGGTVTAGGNIGLALRLAPLRMASSEVTELVVGRRLGRGLGNLGMELAIRKAVLF